MSDYEYKARRDYVREYAKQKAERYKYKDFIKEYGRDDIHTNSVENLWSNIKRSIDGTYQGVSGKHLQRYLDEFLFRYNHQGEQVFFSVLDLLGHRSTERMVRQISRSVAFCLSQPI